jgi:hypothetical protein
LCDELAREPLGIREVVAHYGRQWRATEWRLESPVHVIGPGGFSIRLSAGALQLYHMIPFQRFAAEPALLRDACRALAGLVGAPRAIYHHELLPDGFHDGLAFDQIEATLRAEFGPPAATFAELAAADDYGPGCWYVDDFTPQT